MKKETRVSLSKPEQNKKEKKRNEMKWKQMLFQHST